MRFLQGAGVCTVTSFAGIRIYTFLLPKGLKRHYGAFRSKARAPAPRSRKPRDLGYPAPFMRLIVFFERLANIAILR